MNPFEMLAQANLLDCCRGASLFGIEASVGFGGRPEHDDYRPVRVALGTRSRDCIRYLVSVVDCRPLLDKLIKENDSETARFLEDCMDAVSLGSEANTRHLRTERAAL